MSGVTAVDPISLDNAPRRHATIPLPEEPSDQPETTGGNADEPAVVVSLSIEATTAMQDPPTMLSLDPDEVDHALSWAVGVNRFAPNAAHTTKANVAADTRPWNEADAAAAYAAAIAERDIAEVIDAAVGSPSEALYHAANLGIPILCSVNLDAAGHDASSRTTGIGAFTFTHGGSTYAIVPVADDLLIGTRDGEAWKTWQRANPGDAPDAGMATAAGLPAPAALQALPPLAAEQEIPRDEPLPRIDVSA
jgi:hypothetical protein